MHESESDRKLFERSKVFFDKRFSKYNFAIKKAYQKRYCFVLSCIEIKPGDMVADIGCAQGGMLLACKESHAKSYGVDFSYEALRIAKKSGLDNLICADAQKLPFHNNLFDKIIALQTIEVLQDKTSALDEMRRIAKTDATFYFEVRNGSFILRRLSKFIRRVFRGIVKEIKPDLLFNEDPSYDKWTEMLKEHGYRIVRSIKTPAYLCYENPVQFLKTIAIKMVYFLCPAKYCFTLSFLCKKRFY
jgi:ubiquinone/menaquinone biosynthesis C-methylase UbiE